MKPSFMCWLWDKVELSYWVEFILGPDVESEMLASISSGLRESCCSQKCSLRSVHSMPGGHQDLCSLLR